MWLGRTVRESVVRVFSRAPIFVCASKKTPPVKVALEGSLGERHSRNYFMVGMANSAPLRMPVGQRVVTAFMRV